MEIGIDIGILKKPLKIYGNPADLIAPDGTSHWRAVVRIKGYPTVCNHFDRKQEAEDWAADVEREIKLGKFKFDQHKQQYTFSQLLDRYIIDGVLEHIRSADDVKHHLNYWKFRLGNYALVHLTPELIGQERLLLANTPTNKNQKRSAATVNRYLSSLSALLSHAVQLRWMDENPCFRLTKLKENPGRDRVLSDDEISRLLITCQQSKSAYLYCFVLMSLTTGARQGELLGLEWRHVDFENQLAYLKETKNGRPRSISLAESVIAELKLLYQERNPAKPLVFASKTAFGKVDLKKAWQEALKRARIDNCRVHDMRHTFCTLAARQGASNLELATAMGHRTLGMLQRYTHLDVKVTKKFSKNISEQILQGFHSEDNRIIAT
jgi:integrase